MNIDSISLVYSYIKRGCKVNTDSRQPSVNTVFFALKGENFDGNMYAESAIERGAVLAVVDNPDYAKKEKTVLVPNVLEFLQQLALHHRKKLNIPIIALTGTNGKTTTKELLASVISKKHNVLATEGNLNNHIGVPLTILSITSSIDIAIIEMGANHIGEIEKLCAIARPTHGLITNVGKAHLEGFGSTEGVKIAKGELYQYLQKNSGTIFINRNNLTLRELAKSLGVKKYIDFGFEIVKESILSDSSDALTFTISIDGELHNVSSQLNGSYNIENIIAAICIGNFFDIDFESAKKAISDYIPSNNRSQNLTTEHNKVILDAYNANPSSMELALKNLNAIPSAQKKVVILGEMLELGQFSEEEHKRIVDLALSFGFDRIILTGKGFYNSRENLTWVLNVNELIGLLEREPIANCIILVKGSRGVKLERTIKYL